MTALAFLYLAIFAALLAALLLPNPRASHAAIAIAGLIGAAYGYRQHGAYALALPVLVVLIGVVQASRGSFAGRGARFTREERAMLRGPLKGLDRGTARHLLDQGVWIDADAGDVLAHQDQPVTHLHWLARGKAELLVDDRACAHCGPRDFVGEATVFNGEPSMGTVRLLDGARIWSVDAETLRAYADTHPDIRHHLDRGFAESLADKLEAMNRPG